MPVTRSDVVDAYEVILGRPPEHDDIISAQLAIADDKVALARNILNSKEARRRLSLEPTFARDQHQHHIYKGYTEEDVSTFDKFARSHEQGTPGFVTNFIGCRYRVSFATALSAHDGEVEGYPLPAGGYQGETAEYIGALRSVLEARGSRYRMLECGAGYGTWMAFTYAAAKQKGFENIHVYGVEGDAGHFAFLRQHMEDNSILTEHFTAFNGAIGVNAGSAEWPVAENPADVYGGRPLSDDGGDYHGSKAPRSTTVQVFALGEILRREPYWDLVHMDIQGGEGVLCRDCIGELSDRVGRVIVGTHSRELDGKVMAVFYNAGDWTLENEKPTIFHWREEAASLETLAAVDGLQIWRNNRIRSI